MVEGYIFSDSTQGWVSFAKMISFISISNSYLVLSAHLFYSIFFDLLVYNYSTKGLKIKPSRVKSEAF